MSEDDVSFEKILIWDYYFLTGTSKNLSVICNQFSVFIVLAQSFGYLNVTNGLLQSNLSRFDRFIIRKFQVVFSFNTYNITKLGHALLSLIWVEVYLVYVWLLLDTFVPNFGCFF